MSTTQCSETPGQLLGFAGMVLAIAGVVAVLFAHGTLRGETELANGAYTVLFMIVPPIILTWILMTLLSNRGRALIWLVMGGWTGFLAALTIFSVGIIFLIATVFLLAAFVRANW